MLAACGLAQVAVVRRPKVAVLSTGDELVAPGAAARSRPASTTAMAPSLPPRSREAGGEPIATGRFSRRRGGAGKGRARGACGIATWWCCPAAPRKAPAICRISVVSRLGKPGILVHGVALKPGKPLCLAVVGDKPIVVLPGFPTSAIFTFHAFVAPVIRARAGLPPEAAQTVTARVPVRIASELGRKEFLLVSLVDSDEGTVAFPTGKGSGSVTSFSQADGFLEIDALASALDAGSETQVTLIGSAARAPDLVVMGSHDVALDVVVGALAERGFSARVLAVGSQGGVAAASRGECDIAPVHLIDPETGNTMCTWCTPGLRLVPGWQRMQGILFRPGDKRFEGKSAAEALESRARRYFRADGQPQCRLRHPRADRQVARGRAAARLRQPAEVAQRRRCRDRARAAPTGASPSSRWRSFTASASCRWRRNITISSGRKPRASARRCRHSWRPCATRRRANASRALGMQPSRGLSSVSRSASRSRCVLDQVAVVLRCCCLPLALSARRRNCAATAGRCARWRFRRTAAHAVSGSFDTSAIRWSLERNVAEQVMRFHDTAVNAVAWLKDGRIVTAGADAHIAIWTQGKPDARHGARRPQRPDRRARGVARRQDGSPRPRGITRVRLWPLDGGAPRVLEGNAQNVNGVAFSPDGTRAGQRRLRRDLAHLAARRRRRDRAQSADAAQFAWRSRPTARSSRPAPTARSISCRRRASCAARCRPRRRRSSRSPSRPTASWSPPPASAARWR